MRSEHSLFLRFALALTIVAAAIGCRDERPMPAAATTAPAPAPATPSGDLPDAKPIELTAETAPESVTPVKKDVSSIGFTGRKVTGYHDGKFTRFDGRIEYQDYEPSRVIFEIDTASVTTGIDRLDNHLRSPDFFDAAKYPRATFTSESIAPDTDKWESGTYQLSGVLDLRGVRKTISFPVKVTLTPQELRTQAEFAIDRQEWNIAYKGKVDDLIRDDVAIRLDLRFPPPPRKPPQQAQ